MGRVTTGKRIVALSQRVRKCARSKERHKTNKKEHVSELHATMKQNKGRLLAPSAHTVSSPVFCSAPLYLLLCFFARGARVFWACLRH